MKKFALILLMLCCSTALFARNDVPKGWTTDINSALVKARREHKQVLVLFTGSDWCGYCIRLKKDVLDKKQFQKVAPTKYVLVYFDFPNKKRLSASQRKMQTDWASRMGVNGYPTTVILDKDGKKVKVIPGYRNAQSYLEALFPEMRRR